jgi:murein DD-endopeptidase MepM/ murein hydrolase activator NlpD
MKFMRRLLPTAHFPQRRALNVGSACAALVLALLAAGPAAVAESSAPHVATRDTAVPTVGHTTSESAKVRRFWVKDKHFYFSKWYAGKHRKMINFGCTKAPWYDPSPRCPGDEGFHHGVDIAMKCGTRLFAGLRGTVVRPSAPGSLGSAYGPYAFRLRNHRLHLDFVIGHVRRVYVGPGDHVAKGTLMARASDQGAPDGCHLHFEVRPQGASFDDAINPMRYLDLRRHRVR